MEWNDDSYDDVIVGDRSGYVNFFRRNADGTLTTMPKITCAGVTIQVDGNSAPACVDWDEDGDIDLVLGTQAGNIRLYLNDGGDSQPVFSSYTDIASGGTPISIYRACPQVYDLNGDGKKDLIVGGDDAYIRYFENTGTNSSPAFSGSVQLQSAGAPLHEYYGVRLSVYDWNGDGLPDILTSDYDGYVRLYLANSTGIGGEHGLVPRGSGMRVTGSPTSGGFSVGLTLDSPGPVAIAVYSQDGRLVSTEELGVLGPGTHGLSMDLSGRAPGVYHLVCASGSGIMSSRVVLTE